MSDSAHLLIAFASAQADASREALRALALPHLEKLLARLAPGEIEAGDAESLSMPHERLLARAAGVRAADGCLPLAAMRHASTSNAALHDAWAWITPCHWRVGIDHIVMANPDDLQLSQEESQAVLAAIRPYFEEDGIAIDYESPMRWIARGDVFRGLATASLDRVAGRDIDAWVPRAPKAGPLRRLQQEMQMLLYTHAVSDVRQANGHLPVNSFWVSGAGALGDASDTSDPFNAAGLAHWRVDARLRAPALSGNWSAWADAWRALDATEFARLLAELDAGRAISLALCGESSAQIWKPRESGGHWNNMGARLAALMGRKQAHAILEAL